MNRTFIHVRDLLQFPKPYLTQYVITRLKQFTVIRFKNTAGFMNTVPPVYTLLMITIYLSLSTQVAEETVFKKHSS